MKRSRWRWLPRMYVRWARYDGSDRRTSGIHERPGVHYSRRTLVVVWRRYGDPRAWVFLSSGPWWR